MISVGPLKLKGRASVACSGKTVFSLLDVNMEGAAGSSCVTSDWGPSLRTVLPHQG